MAELPKVPRDKVLHFGAGGIIAFVATVTLAVVTGDLAAGFSLGYAVGMGLGFVKEIRDSKRGGHVELMDFLATAGGAGVGAVAGAGIVAGLGF